MGPGETLYVKSRNDWRRWLAKYHDKKREVWLVVYKKSSGRKPALGEAVEEALCLDGLTARLDPLMSLGMQAVSLRAERRASGPTKPFVKRGQLREAHYP